MQKINKKRKIQESQEKKNSILSYFWKKITAKV